MSSLLSWLLSWLLGEPAGDVARRILDAAPMVLTSRVTLVEAARGPLRAQHERRISAADRQTLTGMLAAVANNFTGNQLVNGNAGSTGEVSGKTGVFSNNTSGAAVTISVFVVWATRRSRSRRPPPATVMRGRTGLICTRAWSCRPASGIGSSGCAAMRCVRP